MVSKKILVTGSCGFIFSNFVRLALRHTDYSFAAIDKVAKEHTLNNVVHSHARHNFHIADIADAHIIDRIFTLEKPDIVIHGAAESHVDDSINSADCFIKSNIVGTQVIIDASIRHNVEKLIYISTDEVYGQLGKDDNSWTEDALIMPRNPYSASKAAGELLVRAAGETHGLKYNITRSCNNYGPRQSTKNLIPKIIKNILNKEPVPIYGQGLQSREWIHVADNCFAILHILKHAPNNETYNISAGHEMSNLEMFHLICEALGQGHDLITFVEDRKGHDFRYSVDFSKIKSIGWKPQFRLKKGLDQCINWYLNNRWFMNYNKCK